MFNFYVGLASAMVYIGGDTIELRQNPETSFYEVEYTNSLDKSSQNKTHLLELDEVKVYVTVEIVGDGPELLTVEVPEEVGLMPFPAESLVPDGKSAVVELLPPMF